MLLRLFLGTCAFAAPLLLLSQLQLRVSSDGSHLRNITADTTFFYLGDTAWELLHRSQEEEARDYLEDRAAKGFNVIQTVVLAELEGLTSPNAYGDLPLKNSDPTEWNEAYFTYVDRVAEMADSLGLFLGLLPTWGDKFNLQWGVGPEIFTPENAEVYGRRLGERYGRHNVIWILGGDRIPADEEDSTIIRAMARGLRLAIGDRQLITYHPQGGYRSTDFFAGEDWIDFHMYQTGHGRLDDRNNYEYPHQMAATDPGKPIINGEPAYEDHPINWRPDNGWFDDFDSRQAAWWSVLAGNAGHTFGNHNIWQLWQPGRAPISRAHTPWMTAMHYPGAAQIGHLGRLMASLPYYLLQPDESWLLEAPNSSGRDTRVARSENGDWVVAYTPYGHTLRTEAEKLPADASFTWFDPRTGQRIPFAPDREGNLVVFDPPYAPARGNDWVLLVSSGD
ncbi:hypothetical protein GGR26_001558 [Lewinella marina]|uniref:DUF4038 domain-containing protein n=1 Tax=Neolewinella marina TaxID=438751 RepID=A0A2G0CEW1_9BACT|nr:DUF4038 domain-containing protein [Neolewinella marina]NJB85813.1 hypothetical protein [Neolewinella marina]PHK98518.1 hypothetical protein CGL56_08555 [Neolewinella marina]